MENVKTHSIALIRADDAEKIGIALHDLEYYGKLNLTTSANFVSPERADRALCSVMGKPLKACCGVAAVVGLADTAGKAIGQIRKMHPPAHIAIVSERHAVFPDLYRVVKGQYLDNDFLSLFSENGALLSCTSIAQKAGCDWRTAERHCDKLAGAGKLKIIYREDQNVLPYLVNE
jgi:hypothetical protein